MKRVTCPHCGGSVGIPWDEVDPLLREGSLSLAEVASRYGTSADWLRQRCRRLGLPRRGPDGRPTKLALVPPPSAPKQEALPFGAAPAPDAEEPTATEPEEPYEARPCDECGTSFRVRHTARHARFCHYNCWQRASRRPERMGLYALAVLELRSVRVRCEAARDELLRMLAGKPPPGTQREVVRHEPAWARAWSSWDEL